MLEATPVETPRKDETRELRLALVCYGGVSLAIWMHGVTKELQKLVEASEAYDDPARGRPPGGTEAVYYDMLEALERDSKWGIRTRVVVDIVAGTSAGGINGIVLAKALAAAAHRAVPDGKGGRLARRLARQGLHAAAARRPAARARVQGAERDGRRAPAGGAREPEQPGPAARDDDRLR